MSMWDGVRGLANVAAGRDKAPPWLVRERRLACLRCPARTFAIIRARRLVVCRECDCFILAKTRLASQYCPRGYW